MKGDPTDNGAWKIPVLREKAAAYDALMDEVVELLAGSRQHNPATVLLIAYAVGAHAEPYWKHKEA